jgi:hypothetical protein
MQTEKPKPAETKTNDPQKKPGEEKGQDAIRSSRNPDTEPPKQKRSDDL